MIEYGTTKDALCLLTALQRLYGLQIDMASGLRAEDYRELEYNDDGEHTSLPWACAAWAHSGMCCRCAAAWADMSRICDIVSRRDSDWARGWAVHTDRAATADRDERTSARSSADSHDVPAIDPQCCDLCPQPERKPRLVTNTENLLLFPTHQREATKLLKHELPILQREYARLEEAILEEVRGAHQLTT